MRRILKGLAAVLHANLHRSEVCRGELHPKARWRLVVVVCCCTRQNTDRHYCWVQLTQKKKKRFHELNSGSASASCSYGMLLATICQLVRSEEIWEPNMLMRLG